MSLLLCFFIFCSLTITVSASTLKKEGIAEKAKGNGVHTYSITTIKDGVVETVSTENQGNIVFEGGSLGKPVTAYICMKLIDEGKLSLDDTIERYLGEEWITDDTRFEKITIRQLLSHTSGFSPSFEMGVDKNLYFEPGNHFSYSGVGYIYLQQIIEQLLRNMLLFR